MIATSDTRLTEAIALLADGYGATLNELSHEQKLFVISALSEQMRLSSSVEDALDTQKFQFVPEWQTISSPCFRTAPPTSGQNTPTQGSVPSEKLRSDTCSRIASSVREPTSTVSALAKRPTTCCSTSTPTPPITLQHDPFAITRILEALEPLGLYKPIALSSSYSDGIHLYFPFLMAQTSWAIAQAVACLLESKGLKVNRGQLELFPGGKRCGAQDERRWLQFVEKSKPYVCRPPNQLESRIYLTFREDDS